MAYLCLRVRLLMARRLVQRLVACYGAQCWHDAIYTCLQGSVHFILLSQLHVVTLVAAAFT